MVNFYTMDRPVIILHNLRSVYNVGSILRTAACFADFTVYCTGTTPYPYQQIDSRLPHIAMRQTASIAKTSLGAERMLTIKHTEVTKLVTRLRAANYTVVACEQVANATPLTKWQPEPKTAVIFGNEPAGIEDSLIALSDMCIEIPMPGKKSSLNVASAAAIALHYWSETSLSTGLGK